MLTDQQLALAVAGVCVLAVLLMVVARRRRHATAPKGPAAEAGRTVLARTHDGTQYQGALVEMGGSREYLTLAGPIVFRRTGTEPETMPPAWDRLTLPLSDVAEVWTRSTPVAESVTPIGRDTAASATSPADEAAARLLQTVRDDARDTNGDAGPEESSATQHRHRSRRSAATTP